MSPAITAALKALREAIEEEAGETPALSALVLCDYGNKRTSQATVPTVAAEPVRELVMSLKRF